MPDAASVLHRAGRDRVDADALAAEVDRQIAHRRLERRLGDAHDVVVRRHLLGADVGQGQQAAAVCIRGSARRARSVNEKHEISIVRWKLSRLVLM